MCLGVSEDHHHSPDSAVTTTTAAAAQTVMNDDSIPAVERDSVVLQHGVKSDDIIADIAASDSVNRQPVLLGNTSHTVFIGQS